MLSITLDSVLFLTGLSVYGLIFLIPVPFPWSFLHKNNMSLNKG